MVLKSLHKQSNRLHPSLGKSAAVYWPNDVLRRCSFLFKNSNSVMLKSIKVSTKIFVFHIKCCFEKYRKYLHLKKKGFSCKKKPEHFEKLVHHASVQDVLAAGTIYQKDIIKISLIIQPVTRLRKEEKEEEAIEGGQFIVCLTPRGGMIYQFSCKLYNISLVRY